MSTYMYNLWFNAKITKKMYNSVYSSFTMGKSGVEGVLNNMAVLA